MPAGAPSSDQATRIRYVVFMLCCGTSWMLYLHRYLFGLIKPKLKQEFQLSDVDLGLLDSSFAVFYSACQVPLGIAIDAFGVHRMLTGMIVVWCLGLALHAVNPWQRYLVPGRVILGIGQSGVYAALSRATRSWFPAANRTTAQGWIGVFFGRIGGVSTNLLIGSVVFGMYGVRWQSAVFSLALGGILFSVLFGLIYRNSPAIHPHVNHAEAQLILGSDNSTTRTVDRRTIRDLFRRMSPRSVGNLLSLNGQMLLSAAADDIFASWIPLFLFAAHQLSDKEMGFYSALPLMGGAVGGAMGGWLNDLLIRHTGNRRRSRTCIGLAGKGMAGILLLVAMRWYDEPHTFCGILIFVKFFSDWSLATTWGAITDIGGRETATVFAVNNMIGSVGPIIAPVIYGWIAGRYGWDYVFPVAAAVYFLCALSWLLFNSNIPVLAEVEGADAAVS